MENTDFTRKIYLVGGAVRDGLLKLPIKDKDYVAVGFSEEDFAHLPKVGKSFPVFLQKDGSQIALARREKKTQHGYNGFSIETQQVSLYEDLKRRDLTLNAIAFDETTQTYYDPFNGKKDLENKILRHISEAFCEDPLRVLRAARLRARLGMEWKIHQSTKVLIYKMRDELCYLEKNRVYKEVESALLGQNSHLFFESLFELGVLDMIFPSIYALTTLKEGNLHHLEASVFAHTMEVLKHTDSQKNTKQCLILKFAALYHDIAKPYCYRNFGNSQGHDNLKIIAPLLDISIPNAIKKPMLLLIQNHIKIYLLPQMRLSKCVKFFDSYKKDSILLELQLDLLLADKQGRISQKFLDSNFLDFKKTLLNTFNTLLNYSPKEWIAQNNPTPNAIQTQVLKEKIRILKKDSTFLSLQKCL
ncbi:polynucleotide adenylyltransferase [Helicobacter winghamensis]|uniref:polynucleotide adenylyltransferase n=1 Tax=Helicobacter winghamensis TaxID=157268 RepID=UPI0001A28BFF|nr:polynucleotide adenylyltransferase [Helicobacter winghamensis]EEO26788.1 putative multifunctional CCA protein [Helicobacter winghamensis ATCC BAA-430]PKT79137.1 polynucleotide adenylyltransferase [Helicobacter winghamensis]PKT79289.1 polynucleotide adenylyltransferase [Helicobacter winghamensis]